MTSSFCSGVLGRSLSYTGSTYSEEEEPSLEERRRVRDRESLSTTGDASGDVAPARQEVVVLDDSSMDAGNAAVLLESNRCSVLIRAWSSDVYAFVKHDATDASMPFYCVLCQEKNKRH